MAQVVHYGYSATLYFNSGSYGSPTWNLVPNVKEVMVNFSLNKEDASTRLGGGWDHYEPTMGDISVTGKIRTDEGDTTGFAALETATLTGAIIDIMALTGPKATNGNRGVRFVAKNFKWSEDQDVKGVDFREFELAPCIDDNPPAKTVVSAGSPVFSSMAR